MVVLTREHSARPPEGGAVTGHDLEGGGSRLTVAGLVCSCLARFVRKIFKWYVHVLPDLSEKFLNIGFHATFVLYFKELSSLLVLYMVK